MTAIAFNAVGNATAMADGSHALPFGSSNHLANIAGHAAVGCAAAVASGGKCGPGALSGAAGSFASPLLAGANLGLVGNTAAHALVGGLASVAGGGKFGNGAVTAAFGYLFNELGSSKERGYEASTYGDSGMMCNGEFAGGACHQAGIQQSYILENAAMVVSGVGSIIRSIYWAAESVGYILSAHAAGQMEARGITEGMVRVALEKGTPYFDPKNDVINYVLKGGFASGKDLLVGFNAQTQVVTTVIRGTNLVRPRFQPMP